jgi:hypothetical protein
MPVSPKNPQFYPPAIYQLLLDLPHYLQEEGITDPMSYAQHLSQTMLDRYQELIEAIVPPPEIPQAQIPQWLNMARMNCEEQIQRETFAPMEERNMDLEDEKEEVDPITASIYGLNLSTLFLEEDEEI